MQFFAIAAVILAAIANSTPVSTLVKMTASNTTAAVGFSAASSDAVFNTTMLDIMDKRGANCKGSPNCYTYGRGDSATRLRNHINEIDDNQLIRPNEQIACVRAEMKYKNAICAFLHYTKPMLAKQIKPLTIGISGNCQRCGSFPLSGNEKDDPKNGELIFNFVRLGCIGGDYSDYNSHSGVCPQRNYTLNH